MNCSQSNAKFSVGDELPLSDFCKTCVGALFVAEGVREDIILIWGKICSKHNEVSNKAPICSSLLISSMFASERWSLRLSVS